MSGCNELHARSQPELQVAQKLTDLQVGRRSKTDLQVGQKPPDLQLGQPDLQLGINLVGFLYRGHLVARQACGVCRGIDSRT